MNKGNLCGIIILLFSAITSCSKEGDLTSDKNTLLNNTTINDPMPSLQILRGCINTYFDQAMFNPSNTDIDTEFRKCIASISPAQLLVHIPTQPPPLTPASPSYYLEQSTLQQFIGITGIINPITTQDSVTVFSQNYSQLDSIYGSYMDTYGLVNTIGLNGFKNIIIYATKDHSLFKHFYMNAGGVLVPSIGYKYIKSICTGTLKFPVSWQSYGFNFRGTYEGLTLSL